MPAPIVVRPSITTCDEQLDAGAELDLLADDAIGADHDIVGQPRARLRRSPSDGFVASRDRLIVQDHRGEYRFGHQLVVDLGPALELPDIAAVALLDDVDVQADRREIPGGESGRCRCS